MKTQHLYMPAEHASLVLCCCTVSCVLCGLCNQVLQRNIKGALPCSTSMELLMFFKTTQIAGKATDKRLQEGVGGPNVAARLKSEADASESLFT